MKIICIGRNYIDHAKELDNPVPKKPLIFLKPDSSLLRKGFPFVMPAFSSDIHFECELVVRINKVGRHIQEEFAHRYYSEFSLGIDFTARDVQSELKSKGHPWEISKGFDGSCAVGVFLPKADFDLTALQFTFLQNQIVKQQGNTSDMIFSTDHIIAYVSQFYTLKKGDLIFTGTPAGVGPVQEGDRLQGRVGEYQLFSIDVK